MKKRWIEQKPATELINSVVVSARIPELIAAVLVSRGLTSPEQAKAFLVADFKTGFHRPGFLPGCDAVADRLHAALLEGKSIAVYGDYDVDGITGTTILHKTLRDLGCKNVFYYIPSRREGYGLNENALRSIADKGYQVVVTVDCGITSVKKAKLAQELGLELLITDHHNPGPELPEAVAIAHPQLVRFPADGGEIVSPVSLTEDQLREAKKYPFPELCGATVALKVAMRLNEQVQRSFQEKQGPGQDSTKAQKLKPLSSQRIRELIVLASLGTVADCMPLLDENRVLVRKGLEILNTVSISVGLDELLRVSGYGTINEDYVSFQITPRINAAGRIQHANIATDLLLSDNSSEAARLASDINRLNEKRKFLQDWVFDDSVRQIDELREQNDENPPAYIFQIPGQNDVALDGLRTSWEAKWNEPWDKRHIMGVTGIVAGRIADKFHRPTILLTRDDADETFRIGSGRSAGDFNLFQAVKTIRDQNPEFFERFGGHAAAVGLKIKAEFFDDFRTKFLEHVKSLPFFLEEQPPEICLDGEFPLAVFTLNTVEELLWLAPFGRGNPRPIFSTRRVLTKEIKTMKGGIHFSAEFRQGGTMLRGVAFGQGQWAKQLKENEGRPIDIAFQVQLNHYSGKSVELTVLDWKWSDEQGR